jgi:hypothetical protein
LLWSTSSVQEDFGDELLQGVLAQAEAEAEVDSNNAVTEIDRELRANAPTAEKNMNNVHVHIQQYLATSVHAGHAANRATPTRSARTGRKATPSGPSRMRCPSSAASPGVSSTATATGSHGGQRGQCREVRLCKTS